MIIIVYGYGFSNVLCYNKVMLSLYECEVIFFDDIVIVCMFSIVEYFIVGEVFDVIVKILNWGYVFVWVDVGDIVDFLLKLSVIVVLLSSGF